MHPLIIKYIEKTVSSEETDELIRLVSTDSEIREEFAMAQNIYALSALIPSEEDEKEGLIQLQKFKERYLKKKERRPMIRKIVRYAAVICVTVATTLLFTKKVEEEVPVSFEEFNTPPGQRAMLKLYDGTTVWLNAASTLRYPNVFTGKTRHVELNGEAFFDVVFNENQPFVVSTERLDIKVLGTKFNVFAYKGKDEFNTFLEEGLVKIYNTLHENDALYLNPNEIAELKENRLEKRTVNGKNFLLWREGIYAFDDIPFKEIIKKLELYYDITIEIKNKDLANYHFSGKFRQRDGVVSALRTFQKAYYFSFYKNDDLNHITIK